MGKEHGEDSIVLFEEGPDQFEALEAFLGHYGELELAFEDESHQVVALSLNEHFANLFGDLAELL